MSYQFVHMECYSRQAGAGKKGGWSAADIAAEAERLPGACPHVADPAPMQVLCGKSPSEAVAEATAWAEASTDAIGRKLRADGLCLLAGVVSLPAEKTDKWDDCK